MLRSRRRRRSTNRKLYGLTAARMRVGLTKSELSRRSGVSQPTLSRLEYLDYAAKPETIMRLARALRVEPGVLVKKPEEKEEA